MITEQQAEEIVLLCRLTGMNQIDAIKAFGLDEYLQYDLDYALFTSLDTSVKLVAAMKKLDAEYKDTHTYHTSTGTEKP